MPHPRFPKLGQAPPLLSRLVCQHLPMLGDAAKRAVEVWGAAIFVGDRGQDGQDFCAIMAWTLGLGKVLFEAELVHLCLLGS